MDYLADLLKEKQHLSLISNALPHAERLVDEEISRARSVAFKGELSCEDLLKLPDPKGEMVKLTEKVFLPIRAHPGYNFVGRILGPRGMTAKQLEQETGCKIMIRGKGSLRDEIKEEFRRGKPNYEHLEDQLHVLIQCEDTKERAAIKLEQAVSQIKKLLILPTAQGIDELKRKQLMELSIINGTYRPPSIKYQMSATPRLHPIKFPPMQPMMPFSPGFAPPLPSFFDSPLPSPMRNADCMTPSYVDLYQQCGSVQSPQKKLDYNLNMIIKALNEKTIEPMKNEVKANPSEKSPWMLEQSWRSNSSSSGSGNEVRAGFGGKVLTCSGCGAMKSG